MAGAPQNYLAVIKVIGVGGGGVNAVNRMIDAGLKGVEFVAVNTDAQALLMSDADVKLDIGRDLTRGLGAGSDPEVGRNAAESHRDEIEEIIKGADMVFITAGEGGGTGTGAAPIIAETGAQHRRAGHRCRHPAVQLRGSSSLGAGRRRCATLKEKVDTLIVIPNDRLLTVANEKTSVLNAFKMADEVLLQGVSGITNLITTPGLINTDFADVKMILSSAGSALMGIGQASGENRAVTAAKAAISSPLLEAAIDGARGILLNITGPSGMSSVRDERGSRDHPRCRPPGRQHHLRHGHRRRDGRRGQGHRHRRRLRSLGQRRDRARRPGGKPTDKPTASLKDLFAEQPADPLDDPRRRLRCAVVPEVTPRVTVRVTSSAPSPSDYSEFASRSPRPAVATSRSSPSPRVIRSRWSRPRARSG